MIAIISYHKEPNYGTMLQAYALAQAIRNLGKDCRYLDYVKMRKHPLPLLLLRKLKHFIERRVLRRNSLGEFAFFNTEPFSAIMQRFNSFHDEHIPVDNNTYYIDTVAQTANDYERYIVGSDQTWSPLLNQHPYTQNFLEFCPSGTKKSSYAPSIGTLAPPQQYVNRMAGALKTFDYLSCREKSNCQTLSETLDRPVEYVVDPTLLLDEREWMKVSCDGSTPQQPYILAYILGTKHCISDFAEELGKSQSLPVYYIATRPEFLHRDHVIADAGPAEFISLIKNARYVVTDSFHGTIFSINFNVNFYSFTKRAGLSHNDNANDNDRIPAILAEYGLSERFHNDDDKHFSPDIDFTAVNATLAVRRQCSAEYLHKIINY